MKFVFLDAVDVAIESAALAGSREVIALGSRGMHA